MSGRTVQCGTTRHNTLHHCLSSNSSLENGERELGHLFRYCRNCKNTSIILLRERYSATGNSSAKPFTRPFPSLAEVGRACVTIWETAPLQSKALSTHAMCSSALKCQVTCSSVWLCCIGNLFVANRPSLLTAPTLAFTQGSRAASRDDVCVVIEASTLFYPA